MSQRAYELITKNYPSIYEHGEVDAHKLADALENLARRTPLRRSATNSMGSGILSLASSTSS